MSNKGNHADAQSDDTEEHKKSLKRSWKTSGPVAKLTVVFAGIAALSTSVYAVAAWGQLVKMSAQLSQMQDASKLERPWIGPTARNINFDSAKGSQPAQFRGLDWRFRNGGRSVATRVRASLQLKIGPKYSETLPDDAYPLSDTCPKGDLPGYGMVMTPGSTETAVSVFPDASVRAQLDRVHKDADLYLVGCVDYSDGTKKTKYRTIVLMCWRSSFPPRNKDLSNLCSATTPTSPVTAIASIARNCNVWHVYKHRANSMIPIDPRGEGIEKKARAIPRDTTPDQLPRIYFDEKFTGACPAFAPPRPNCSPATIPPNFHAIVSRH